MKKLLLFSFVFISLNFHSFLRKGAGGEAFSQSLDVISDGAVISIYSDSVIIDGNFFHQGNDTIVNSGHVYLTGNWTNNNASSNVFISGPDGWLHLSGGAQIVSGTTLTHFNNLELSGTGIKQLQGIDAEIEDTLALTDREFAAGNNVVNVLNSGTGVVTRTNSMTGGFVSSTNDGGLSRTTLSNAAYSFPVGSSTGTLRYRPVDLTPASAAANTFKVRMANVNPTSESYNISQKDSTLCDVNSNYYHRIFRTNGTDAADIKIYFDAADGNFQTIAHWENTPQWENTLNNTFTSGSPLSSLAKTGWNDFSTNPFALATLAPAAPTVTANGPTTFCAGDSVILNAGSGYSSYSWSNGATSQTVVISASGTYSVTVSNGGTCNASSTNTIVVTVNPTPTPVITSSGSTTLCAGDSIVLDAGTGYSTYLWSTNATTQTINVNTAGNYSVTVTDATGCTGTSTPMSVSVNNPVPTISALDTTVFCAGGDVDLDAGSGFSTYLWSNGEITQTINVDSGGNYSVTVTDAAGCTGVSSAATSVTVFPVPDVLASPDDTINLGTSDTLVAIGAVSYQWQPGNGTGSTFIVNPTEETTYTVIGTDDKGCSDTALVKIYVDSKCVYWLPNIFSPNGDAQNDELKIYGRGLESLSLTVFDRWGNRVFESTDLNTPWDGKYNGGVLNTGVYVYILKGKCLNSGEEFEQHGNVTLTR